MVKRPGEGDWIFRGKCGISWKYGVVITNVPNDDQRGKLAFKKRSTFLASSVANLALVIGNGLRFQSFVLICNGDQTRVQKMGNSTNLLGPRWVIGELWGITVNLTRQLSRTKIAPVV